MSSIKLYHGSIYEFDEIDVEKGKPYKDFGKGFYTAIKKKQAVDLVLRNQLFEKKRLARLRKSPDVKTYLYTYEINIDELAKNDLVIKKFGDDDIGRMEWLDFVLANRNCKTKTHDYDVVIGATADDNTRFVIDNYLDEIYGEVGSDKAKNRLYEELEIMNLSTQYYFGTNRAASFLRFIERTIIK